MRPMKRRLFRMDKVYTLKIDETGGIEYLEEDEVLEDIYRTIEMIQKQVLEILMLVKTNEEEKSLDISNEDIVF